MNALRLSACLPILLPLLLIPGRAGLADEQVKEDGWVQQRDEQTGILVRTKEMKLHRRAAPQPALRYQLIPDAFERIPDNAAIHYLKAMGFLEQDPARDRVSQMIRETMAKANEQGKEPRQLPPYVWLTTPPEELPRDEVREYLRLMSFQRPMLREAARCDRLDMQRNLRDTEDLIGYLLPEIQKMRELARTQSIRCRLAIAEGRLDDAIEIIGQQMALARHLGQDDFLVSNLVGIAIAAIAWNDTLHLVQHPEAPNLYWALTTLPDPLVDMRRSMAVERQFLYQQIRVLQEVDETPRPVGYWSDFIDRLIPQLGMLAGELSMPSPSEDAEVARAALVAFVAAAYPDAKEYLIRVQQLPRDQVQAYPTAQVVFLALVRFHNHWRDEVFKWMYLPYWQARSAAASRDPANEMRAEAERYGWFTAPTLALLPGVFAARTAAARGAQNIALLQTVEAVRLYAADNGGKLPRSLEDLPVPTPVEPFTGKPIDYELLGDRAVLSGHPLPGMQNRLILRLAD